MTRYRVEHEIAGRRGSKVYEADSDAHARALHERALIAARLVGVVVGVTVEPAKRTPARAPRRNAQARRFTEVPATRRPRKGASERAAVERAIAYRDSPAGRLAMRRLDESIVKWREHLARERAAAA